MHERVRLICNCNCFTLNIFIRSFGQRHRICPCTFRRLFVLQNMSSSTEQAYKSVDHALVRNKGAVSVSVFYSASFITGDKEDDISFTINSSPPPIYQNYILNLAVKSRSPLISLSFPLCFRCCFCPTTMQILHYPFTSLSNIYLPNTQPAHIILQHVTIQNYLTYCSRSHSCVYSLVTILFLLAPA